MDLSEAEAPSRVPVAALRALCDPFKGICWRGLNAPITRAEIEQALSCGDLLPPAAGECTSRQQHVHRVAWFVVHGWVEPIDLDVGVPELGCVVTWPVTDGNHRFAAAIYRGEELISAEVSGSCSFARSLGVLAV